ncbi:hypothetical protein KP509_05G025200 [Ceratopteris richardii]|uniref:Protein kinase domain-containing protein n=2 Tax=Ceratopteris richardii TaxID=49495 RepID=A0A8T2UK51_CERRI|nr:hypothetical protein KP509_05G025200 [Ceratopteris richardii]
MTVPVLHFAARYRKLPRMHSYLHSALLSRLHFSECTKTQYNRSTTFGKGDSNSFYSSVLQFTPRMIHTQHAEFKKHSGSNTGFYNLRPFLVLFRAAYIMAEVSMLSVWHLLLKDTQKRAEKLRRCLIRLGPFYVKLGQALSTRPDILPSAYCQELAKLQDRIPPVRSSVALKVIESELGSPARKLFASISSEPVAAASLGQVYKASLTTGEHVAVKVQRPGMYARLVLDSYLLHFIGGPLQRYLGARRDILDAVNEMVQNMFEEINYKKEGRNAERFAVLYGGLVKELDASTSSSNKSYKSKQRWKTRRQLNSDAPLDFVKVPKIYWNLSSKAVLTMEWIDGIKLTDLATLHKMNFNTQKLVDQGVFSSLRQLLEEGFFHADPHPGNLVVTKEGMLAYFDFGMMGDFPREYRIGLIRTLVHFVNRDSLGLANDFLVLGFVPKGANLQDIAVELHASFGDEKSKAQLDFQGIMSQLSNVMYKYNFRLPPHYALVIRALGSLEGTATLLDPEFKVVASAYPFIIGRLLADPDPDMREILRELLIRNNGSIRWHRLERLVVAIADQSSAKSGPSKQSDKGRTLSEQDDISKEDTRSWGMFDTRTVVSATSDLLDFILSDEGYRVRVLLVQDIVLSLNAFLDKALLASMKHDSYKGNGSSIDGEKTNKQGNKSRRMGTEEEPGGAQEIEDFNLRISRALGAFKRAVNSSPELWIILLFNFASRSETHAFLGTLVHSLLSSWHRKGSEHFWLLLSWVIHDMYDTKK